MKATAAILAHIVPAPGNHDALLWPASALMAVGIVAAVAAEKRWVRRGSMLVGCLGLAGMVVIYATDPARPSPPKDTLRLLVVGDSTVAGAPVWLEVCGTTPDGRPAAVPGPGRWMEIVFDGNVITEGTGSQFLVKLTSGQHQLYAEVVPADRVEFVPRIVSPTVTFDVGTTAAPTHVLCRAGA